MAEIVHPRCLSACASTSSPVENMGGGSLRWSVSEPPASGRAPPDWWTIEAQAVPGGWGVSVIESGESYVILNTESRSAMSLAHPWFHTIPTAASSLAMCARQIAWVAWS